MENIVEGNFTQEVKDAWIKALESGRFTQTDGQLKSDNKHCCIGVLGVIHLDLKESTESEISCPYLYLERNGIDFEKLYGINDGSFDENKPDYNNVIPYIKELPVQ